MMEYWSRKRVKIYFITLFLLSPVYIKAYFLTYKNKGSGCLVDKECRGTFVCKGGKCVPATDTAEIHAKQPCPHIFKEACQRHDQCTCDEENLQCIHHECVPVPKSNTINKKPGNICDNHADCAAGHLCEKSKCREAKTYAELIQVLAEMKGCSINADCLPGQECSNRSCLFNNLKKDAKEKQFIRKKCKRHSDCPAEQFCNQSSCRHAVTSEELELIIRKVKACRSHADCKSNKECVFGNCISSHEYKDEAPIERCIKNKDCPMPKICDNFICRTSSSTLELQLLLNEIKVCSKDLDCPTSFECHRKVCVIERNSEVDKCIGETNGLICLDDSFCRPCESISFKCESFRCRMK